MHLLRDHTVQKILRRYQPRSRIHSQSIPAGIPNVRDHHFAGTEISCGDRARTHTLTRIVKIVCVQIAEHHTRNERLRVDTAKVRHGHRCVVCRTTFIPTIPHTHADLIPRRIQHVATMHTAAPQIQMTVIHLLQLINLLRRSTPRQILTNGSRITQSCCTLLRTILAARRVMAEVIAIQHVLRMSAGGINQQLLRSQRRSRIRFQSSRHQPEIQINVQPHRLTTGIHPRPIDQLNQQLLVVRHLQSRQQLTRFKSLSGQLTGTTTTTTIAPQNRTNRRQKTKRTAHDCFPRNSSDSVLHPYHALQHPLHGTADRCPYSTDATVPRTHCTDSSNPGTERGFFPAERRAGPTPHFEQTRQTREFQSVFGHFLTPEKPSPRHRRAGPGTPFARPAGPPPLSQTHNECCHPATPIDAS